MNLKNVIKNPKAYVLVAKKRTINFFRTNLFRGKKVICGICNWRGKLFFDEKCPNCNSLPRIRLVPYSLKYFDLIKNNLKILHIAPNINEYNYVKENFDELLCYDRLDKKERKHTNIKQSITNTDIDSNIYDLVIAWHVFEHIKEDLKAISEIYKVLKKDGKLLVSVPMFPKYNEITFEDTNIKYEDYIKLYGHYDHCRSCGYDYFKRFETVGFTTETLDVRAIEDSDINTYGLLKEHIAWCFTK